MDTVLTFEGYISAKRDAGQELTTAGLLSYEKASRPVQRVRIHGRGRCAQNWENRP